MTCAYCDTRKATHFTDLTSPWDQCCHACYAEHWTACEHCGAETRRDEMAAFLGMPASRSGPAEYDERCPSCAPCRDDDEDTRADRAYDERMDR